MSLNSASQGYLSQWSLGSYVSLMLQTFRAPSENFRGYGYKAISDHSTFIFSYYSHFCIIFYNRNLENSLVRSSYDPIRGFPDTSGGMDPTHWLLLQTHPSALAVRHMGSVAFGFVLSSFNDTKGRQDLGHEHLTQYPFQTVSPSVAFRLFDALIHIRPGSHPVRV
jgi:hypothetical protein